MCGSVSQSVTLNERSRKNRWKLHLHLLLFPSTDLLRSVHHLFISSPKYLYISSSSWICSPEVAVPSSFNAIIVMQRSDKNHPRKRAHYILVYASFCKRRSDISERAEETTRYSRCVFPSISEEITERPEETTRYARCVSCSISEDLT